VTLAAGEAYGQRKGARRDELQERRARFRLAGEVDADVIGDDAAPDDVPGDDRVPFDGAVPKVSVLLETL
jgi:hypothetical protein